MANEKHKVPRKAHRIHINHKAAILLTGIAAFLRLQGSTYFYVRFMDKQWLCYVAKYP